MAVDGDTPEAVALLSWTALNVTAVSTAVAVGTPPDAASSGEKATASVANTGRDDDMGAEIDAGKGSEAGPAGDEDVGASAGGEAVGEGATPSDVPWARASPTPKAPPATVAEEKEEVVITILHAMQPPQLPVWGPDPLFTSDALLSGAWGGGKGGWP